MRITASQYGPHGVGCGRATKVFTKGREERKVLANPKKKENM